jgi:hypothetical protein
MPATAAGRTPTRGAHGLTWLAVHAALGNGCRGLPGGSTLAQLLAEHRGTRNRGRLPPLSEEAILTWADAFRTRAGCWPVRDSGPILDAPGETWKAVDAALWAGVRGLPGGSSLGRVLLAERDVRKPVGRLRRRPHSEARILAWALAHRRRTGRWPSRNSGPVLDALGETWQGIHVALVRGRRGLPGGSSLAKLLRACRALNGE